jgi:hypothetical protein
MGSVVAVPVKLQAKLLLKGVTKICTLACHDDAKIFSYAFNRRDMDYEHAEVHFYPCPFSMLHGFLKGIRNFLRLGVA